MKLLDETIGDFLHDNESLRGNAALARIVHTSPDGPFHRLVEIRVLQNDEGVAAAKLHGRFLQVLAGLSGDDGTGAFATG